MTELIGKIVIAQAFFDDGERIEAITEQALIRNEFFRVVNRGKKGNEVIGWPSDLVTRKFRTADGHKPDGAKVFNTGSELVLDTDIYWGRRRFLAGYSARLHVLGYIEVVGTGG